MISFVKRLAALVFLLATWASPASAQQLLQIDEAAVWQHPHNGIVFPTTLGGLPRARVVQFAPDYLNLGFSYREEGAIEELSVYVYRNTNGGVPVWFEQARTGVEIRDIYANPQLAFGTEQYAWPGAEGWQGLRGVYSTPDSNYSTSTAVALFSVKGWFVKMRATSDEKTAAELAQFMDAAFAELTPPTAEFDQPSIVPVIACEDKLAFKKKAEDAKTDGASSIKGALMGVPIPEEAKEHDERAEPVAAAVWCRDASLNPVQVAYRKDASTDSYLLALGDSGIGASVAPDASLLLLKDNPKKKDQAFAIAVITESERINFVPQNRLPSLERVMEIINSTRQISSVSTWGDDHTITINPDAM